MDVPLTSAWVEAHETEGPFSFPAWANPTDGTVSIHNHDSQIMYGEQVIDIGDSPNPEMLHVKILAQPDAHSNPVTGYINKDHVVSCDRESLGVIMVVQALTTRIRAARRSGDFVVPFGAVLQHHSFCLSGNDVLVTRRDGTEGPVNKSDVRLILPAVEDAEELRAAVCANAYKFYGMPFCWGGRSPFLGNFQPLARSPRVLPTSVDSSGFINLLMHSVGLVVPRNSGSQRQYAAPVAPSDMQPGDLIFLVHPVTKRANYVLMYFGDGEVIEASGLSGPVPKVCITPIAKRFGVPLDEMVNGMIWAGDYQDVKRAICCGSFLNDAGTLQIMRDNFLACVGSRD